MTLGRSRFGRKGAQDDLYLIQQSQNSDSSRRFSVADEFPEAGQLKMPRRAAKNSTFRPAISSTVKG